MDDLLDIRGKILVQRDRIAPLLLALLRKPDQVRQGARDRLRWFNDGHWLGVPLHDDFRAGLDFSSTA